MSVRDDIARTIEAAVRDWQGRYVRQEDEGESGALAVADALLAAFPGLVVETPPSDLGKDYETPKLMSREEGERRMAFVATMPKLYDDIITADLVDSVVDGENVIVMRALIYALWAAVESPTPPPAAQAEIESAMAEPGKDGTPGWAYDEDGYCVCCGNGRWKHHMPECPLRDALDGQPSIPFGMTPERLRDIGEHIDILARAGGVSPVQPHATTLYNWSDALRVLGAAGSSEDRAPGNAK